MIDKDFLRYQFQWILGKQRIYQQRRTTHVLTPEIMALEIASGVNRLANLIFIFILALILILLTFVFPILGARKAIPKVIQIFRQANAVGKRNAKQMEELIPRPTKRNLIKMMYAPRDYRLSALISLMKHNIVQKTEDGKLFLSEKDLAASKWKGY